jgi:hypothetical protein
VIVADANLVVYLFVAGPDTPNAVGRFLGVTTSAVNRAAKSSTVQDWKGRSKLSRNQRPQY